MSDIVKIVGNLLYIFGKLQPNPEPSDNKSKQCLCDNPNSSVVCCDGCNLDDDVIFWRYQNPVPRCVKDVIKDHKVMLRNYFLKKEKLGHRHKSKNYT